MCPIIHSSFLLIIYHQYHLPYQATEVTYESYARLSDDKRQRLRQEWRLSGRVGGICISGGVGLDDGRHEDGGEGHGGAVDVAAEAHGQNGQDLSEFTRLGRV